VEGRVLAGRYRLLKKLGQGGMGSVWVAEHLTLRTRVAVKLIDPAIAESSDALGRFQREAQAAAELRSTHIVQTFDYGIDEGTPFIAMELLDGESLGARIERLGRLTLIGTAQILSQVSRALGRAHERGIVHRDLKPDNVFIVREGHDEIAKVLDFGIAKRSDALSVSSGVKTSTGALLGTPYYMSPEQALGQRNVDHRTDIWSLGIIAYECVTGVRPFDGANLGALLMAICHEPLPRPSQQYSGIPLGFDAWFARTAARDLNARFPSAIEATNELLALCSSIPSGSLEQSIPPDDPRVLSQHPHTVPVTAVTASVTFAGGKKSRRTAWLLMLPPLFVLIVVAIVLRSKWLAHESSPSAALPSTPGQSATLTNLPGAPPLASAANVPSQLSAASVANTAAIAEPSTNDRAVVGSPESPARPGTRTPTRASGSASAGKRPAEAPAGARAAGAPTKQQPAQAPVDDFVGF
jgi:eukaryotic-like serine/threonine-protein kinase